MEALISGESLPWNAENEKCSSVAVSACIVVTLSVSCLSPVIPIRFEACKLERVREACHEWLAPSPNMFNEGIQERNKQEHTVP